MRKTLCLMASLGFGEPRQQPTNGRLSLKRFIRRFVLGFIRRSILGTIRTGTWKVSLSEMTHRLLRASVSKGLIRPALETGNLPN